jgi:nucleotide sugar dehydrogenase
VRESEVVIVIVPALLTAEHDIDASILQAVAKQVARSMRPGTLVSFETTLPVGGTRRLLQPHLEQEGLRAGADFDLVFSPERVKSQAVFQHLTKNPKVVGGHTPAAAARASKFYETYLGAPVINVGTLEAAEMVKLAGMVYRDVNIALSNELARYAEDVGVDLGALRTAINSDGEAYLLAPGIGVGGHCTPVYPYFLIRDAERRKIPTTLAQRSREINDGQAAHMIDQLERLSGKVRGKSVLILGLAFRPQVKEDILSSAYLVRDTLQARGAEVSLEDPLFDAAEIRSRGFQPGTLEQTPGPKVVVLQAGHDAYRQMDFAALARRGVQAVVDGRNLWNPAEVQAAGLAYIGAGRPPLASTP